MKVSGFDLASPTENLIAKSLEAGRFPHAVLIEGGAPEKRADLARRIALALICESKTETPCGVCPHCLKALHDMHPDILYHEPVKKSRESRIYPVEYIREIVNDSYVLPNEASVKVYILSEADNMGTAGQNAFLKTLEEPAPHAMFILLCATKEVFLQTVLSRVTLFNLGEDETLSSEVTEEAKEAAKSVAIAVYAPNEFEIVKAAGVFEKNQKLLQETLPVLEEMFAEALRIKFGAAGDGEKDETAAVLAEKLSRRALLKLAECAEELIKGLSRSANLNLTILRLCTSFRAAAKEQE